MVDMHVPDFLASLPGGPAYTPPPLKEILVDDIGNVRQAGSTSLNTQFIKTFKKMAERNLYFFSRNILGLTRLTPHLHRDFCDFIQKSPPYRKLGLMPRDTFKSTIVAKSLPIHIFIQPRDSNIYFPGVEGRHVKGLLVCEIEARASKHLQWIQAQFEKNRLLRALWPEACWGNPRKDSKKWNAQEFVLPRDIRHEQSDMSLQAIGVGGAITGAHIDFLIKDDLISIDAMNSPVIMQTAIDYHYLTRPLLEDIDKSLEFIVGTRWATSDLYAHIIRNDPSVAVYQRSLVEHGKNIFPEEFSQSAIENLKQTLGPLFALLYQNDPTDASLTDFQADMLRYYKEYPGFLEFDEDDRDAAVKDMMSVSRAVDKPPETDWKPVDWSSFTDKRNDYLRVKYT